MFTQVFHIPDQPRNAGEGFTSRILAYGPGLLVMEWHFEKAGSVTPMHSHYHEQVTHVVKGSTKLSFPDKSAASSSIEIQDRTRYTTILRLNVIVKTNTAAVTVIFQCRFFILSPFIRIAIVYATRGRDMTIRKNKVEIAASPTRASAPRNDCLYYATKDPTDPRYRCPFAVPC